MEQWGDGVAAALRQERCGSGRALGEGGLWKKFMAVSRMKR
jgi:hypothetical protein